MSCRHELSWFVHLIIALTKSRMHVFETVVVIGCGTIGLPSAVAFAERGATVTGVDVDIQRLARLACGDLDRLDDGLAGALQSALARGALRFSTSMDRADTPRAFIIAVQTPVDGAGHPDLAYLDAAMEAVLVCARRDDLIVLRNTVSIGTTRRIAAEIRQRGLTLRLAACPDRSLTGNSYREQFLIPTIIGGVDERSTEAAAALFRRIGEVVPVSSSDTAEAAKLFCNVQRDIQFATANQFALICEQRSIDFSGVTAAAAYHYPRFSIARPGPVGGGCLPKDGVLLAMTEDGPLDTMPLVAAARGLNLSLVDVVANVTIAHVQQRMTEHPTIAILGMAFKGTPPTADRRGSFGVALAEQLAARLTHAVIRTWDPVLSPDADGQRLDDALGAADCVILANDHPFLDQINWREMAARLKPGALIYDACGRDPIPCNALPNAVLFHSFGRNAGRQIALQGTKATITQSATAQSASAQSRQGACDK